MDEHWHQLLKQKWNGIVLQPRQRRKYLHTPLWLQLFQRAAAVQDQLVPHQGEIDCTEITTPMINSCPTRWRTSAASATTRRGASSYPASPPTRWTGCLASSATAWWTSLRGEQLSISIDKKLTFLLFPLIQVSFDRRHLLPLSTSAHNILHSGEFVNTKSLRTNSSTAIVPGEVGGPEVLLVRGLHGLPGGLDLAAAVSQPTMPQALGREPTHLGDDVLLRHFCRRSLLCRSSEGRFQFLRQSNSSIRGNLDFRK